MKIPLSVLAASATALTAIAAATGCGGHSKPATTVTVKGKITITDNDSTATDFTWDEPDLCQSAGGYQDIAPGASVTVHDAAGKVIGLGTIEGRGHAGGFSDLGGEFGKIATTCTFAFTVSDVPQQPKFYGVQVTHRGIVTFSAAQVGAGQVALSIGDPGQ